MELLSPGFALVYRLCRHLRLEIANILLQCCAPAPPLSFPPPGKHPRSVHRQIQLVPLPFLRFGEQSAQDIDFPVLAIGAPLQFLQRTVEASVTSGE
jgi:hypothetical protein